MLNNLNKLIIIGAGGFGVEVFYWLKDFAESLEYSILEKILFIDDNPEGITSNELKKLWFSNLENYKFEESDKIIISVGNPFSRKKIFEKLKKRAIKNYQYFNLVHPSSNISKSARIKNGFIACPFSVVCTDTYIGNHVHINVSSSVGHGAIIDDFSTVSSHCDVMGEAKISKGVFLGSGSRVLPGKKVCQWSKIGAGVTIQKDILVKSTVFQNHPKIVKI